MFISTQGPTKNTFNQFWKMTYHNKSELIIMLCNLFEDTRIKCNQYWPSKIGEKVVYENINTINNSNTSNNPNNIIHQLTMEVEMISEKKILDDMIIERTFIIQPKAKKNENNEQDSQLEKKQWEKRKITQLHVTCWPDHSVPKSNDQFRLFNYLVNCIHSNYKKSYENDITNIQNKDFQFTRKHSPTIIHCSAGIGRTGSLIAIYNVFDHLNIQFKAMMANDKNQDKEIEISNYIEKININENNKINSENDQKDINTINNIQINQDDNLNNSLKNRNNLKKVSVNNFIFFSVFTLVRKLREQRFFFVTDLCQYKIIYRFAYNWIRHYIFHQEEKIIDEIDDQQDSPILKAKNKPFIMKEQIVLNNDNNCFTNSKINDCNSKLQFTSNTKNSCKTSKYTKTKIDFKSNKDIPSLLPTTEVNEDEDFNREKGEESESKTHEITRKSIHGSGSKSYPEIQLNKLINKDIINDEITTNNLNEEFDDYKDNKLSEFKINTNDDYFHDDNNICDSKNNNNIDELKNNKSDDEIKEPELKLNINFKKKKNKNISFNK
jgi:protein tyrosine phosphatase